MDFLNFLCLAILTSLKFVTNSFVCEEVLRMHVWHKHLDDQESRILLFGRMSHPNRRARINNPNDFNMMWKLVYRYQRDRFFTYTSILDNGGL